MKSLAAIGLAFSLVLSALAGPVFAEDGAKGLFFEQLEHPSTHTNTGIQYWIELHHDGQVSRANNKTVFHSGDKIRFYVRPNIDGYAYIMLTSGSKGEQAVLFPIAERSENNRITRGKEIVLPTDGMLSFDENPGTEKLTLLVSRHPIDTEAYLSGNKEKVAPQLVAMASSGSKDLVPNQVLVSYIQPTSTNVISSLPNTGPSEKPAPASGSKVSNKPTSSSPTGSTSSVSSPAPASVPHHMQAAKVVKHPVANHKTKHAGKEQIALGSSTAKPSPTTTASIGQTKNGKNEADKLQGGLVTVVYTNPNGVLAADISLEHL